jgi:2-dehydropantoate 2-reductase
MDEDLTKGEEKMRILVYGAGVQGSQYAVFLHQAGQDVTILARGERLAQIRQHGIVLEQNDSGKRTVTQVPVVDTLKPDDAYDLVLVPMRSNQIESILPVLAANEHTPNVLFLGNNIHGPEKMVAALGRERVLLGFASAAGVREGSVVRHPAIGRGVTYVGELDGQETPRLAQIAAVFALSPFPVKIQPDIHAWLKTHVALVIPFALGIYMCAGDNTRLAHTRDALVLVVRAIREGFTALKARGITITPAYLGRIMYLPEPLLVAFLSRMFNTQFAEIGLAGHANAARDEMGHLTGGLWELVQGSGVEAPALRSLYVFRNPNQPPLREGSKRIPLNTQGFWAFVGVIMAVSGSLLWLVSRLWRKNRREK